MIFAYAALDYLLRSLYLRERKAGLYGFSIFQIVLRFSRDRGVRRFAIKANFARIEIQLNLRDREKFIMLFNIDRSLVLERVLEI